MNERDETKLERIKHVSDLPNWFQLNKYKSAKQLDAAGWYEQLFVRQNLRLALYRLQDCCEDEEYNDERDLDVIDHTFAKIQENPIIDVSTDTQLSEEFLTPTLDELKQRMPHSQLGVHNITVAEFLCIESETSEPLKEIRPQWEKYFRNKCYDDSQIRKWINTPLHKLNPTNIPIEREIVHVNWNLPDTTLIEHFKQFLKTQRPEVIFSEDENDDKYQNLLKKYYRTPDFNAWCRLGILPYLDLTFWALEKNLIIPYRVMADAIYLPGEGGEETIRKTTAPLAEIWMTDEAINALVHHAALQIAE
jgi:hypothetical protein